MAAERKDKEELGFTPQLLDFLQILPSSPSSDAPSPLPY
jgi:hypothetical protein